MKYVFSARSRSKLDTVHPLLRKVAITALKHTEVDFGITCGRRTIEEQERLVAEGASHIMNSRHLTGFAVDVVAYNPDTGRIDWSLPLYYVIAEAFRASAIKLDATIRWGGAWHIPNITRWDMSCKAACEEYVTLRKKEGKKYFIDAVHFEIPRKK